MLAADMKHVLNPPRKIYRMRRMPIIKMKPQMQQFSSTEVFKQNHGCCFIHMLTFISECYTDLMCSVISAMNYCCRHLFASALRLQQSSIALNCFLLCSVIQCVTYWQIMITYDHHEKNKNMTATAVFAIQRPYLGRARDIQRNASQLRCPLWLQNAWLRRHFPASLMRFQQSIFRDVLLLCLIKRFVKYQHITTTCDHHENTKNKSWLQLLVPR